MSQQKLFQPIQVGRLSLQHRIVLAPLTRFKSGRTDHVPDVPLMKEYYAQRASVPGTLLITEATIIAARAGGYPNIPGIWSQPQMDAWKQITDAVHAKNSFIFLQIWAHGRAAYPSVLAAEDPSFPFISASNIKLHDRPASEPAPRALTLLEIDEYVALYAQAARNAVQAGFDGVEVHGANGYLIDQFLQDLSNVRDDKYGGSAENRSRFALRVVDAVVDAIGADRTSLRLSPWSPLHDMGMPDPLPQFTHLISTLARTHTNLAYLHLVEPRATGDSDRASGSHESNDALRPPGPAPCHYCRWVWPCLRHCGAEHRGDLIAFGRSFISNPDLPKRLQKDIPLTPYNRKTFTRLLTIPAPRMAPHQRTDLASTLLPIPIASSEMPTLPIIFAFLLLAAGATNADCVHSTQGHAFEMQLYSQTNCGGAAPWEEFFGAGDSTACQCFNIADALDNGVKSFVFTASGPSNHSVSLSADAGCTGTHLGTPPHSHGLWGFVVVVVVEWSLTVTDVSQAARSGAGST
ncbi:hypothetical protein BD779DRAFT_1671128 [Infundibulicybe gibba]|nr:hypothetical protein BD779DRAFT_1671128 [Infundibulicybe gibba]